MRTLRFGFVACIGCMAATSFAQAWVKPYESGLRAAKAAKWDEARAQFLEAIKHRGDDSDKVSVMGGSVADRKPWRGGAPYSPNFGAAYASFKLAVDAPDQKTRTDRLNEAIAGFSSVISKGQESPEALLFLAAAYAAQNETKKASDIQARLNQIDQAKAFKVDREIIAADDIRIMQGNTVPVGPTGGDPRGGVEPGSLPKVGIGTPSGLVPIVENKFALLVGNSQGAGLTFAENDVDILKEALIKHAGYADTNIVVVKNGSAETIMQQAKALADRIPDSAIVFLFYAGAGVYNPDTGKDYLAAADTPDLTSFDKMIQKLSLFAPFISKGASIFSFFEVDRPINSIGKYFGMEVPQVGRIAQSQGDMPGERAYGTMFEGKSVGVYAYAMAQVLAEMRNNRIPVMAFAWSTFNKVRRSTEGGGAQTPTLPVVVSMTTTARF